jgi:glutaredoxin
MTEPTFLVVSIPGCPYCALVKQELRQRGYSFTETKCKTPEEKDDFKAKHGTTTFPQVFVNNERIGGYEATVEYLDNLKKKG